MSDNSQIPNELLASHMPTNVPFAVSHAVNSPELPTIQMDPSASPNDKLMQGLNQGGVPLVAPDGHPGFVHRDALDTFLGKNPGYTTGAVVTAPDGHPGIVPHDALGVFLKANPTYKLGQSTPRTDAVLQDPRMNESRLDMLNRTVVEPFKQEMAPKSAWEEIKRDIERGINPLSNPVVQAAGNLVTEGGQKLSDLIAKEWEGVPADTTVGKLGKNYLAPAAETAATGVLAPMAQPESIATMGAFKAPLAGTAGRLIRAGTGMGFGVPALKAAVKSGVPAVQAATEGNTPEAVRLGTQAAFDTALAAETLGGVVREAPATVKETTALAANRSPYWLAKRLPESLLTPQKQVALDVNQAKGQASNLAAGLETGGSPSSKSVQTYEDVAQPILPDVRAEAAKQGITEKDFEGRKGYAAAQKITKGVRQSYDDAYNSLLEPLRGEYAGEAAKRAAAELVDKMLGDSALMDEIQKGDPSGKNVQALRNLRDSIANVRTIGQLDDMRQALNRLSGKYEARSAGQQYLSPLTQETMHEGANSIRNVLYKEMERLHGGRSTPTEINQGVVQNPAVQDGVTESQIRELQRNHGAAIQADDLMQQTARNLSSQSSAESALPSWWQRVRGNAAPLEIAGRPKMAATGFMKSVLGFKPPDATEIFNTRMKRVLKGAAPDEGTTFPQGAMMPEYVDGRSEGPTASRVPALALPAPTPFADAEVVGPRGPRQLEGNGIDQRALPPGVYEQPPSPTSPLPKALPPATLPAEFAPPTNRVEAVGIPQTAEAQALQNRFEQKPAGFTPPKRPFFLKGSPSPSEGSAVPSIPPKAQTKTEIQAAKPNVSQILGSNENQGFWYDQHRTVDGRDVVDAEGQIQKLMKEGGLSREEANRAVAEHGQKTGENLLTKAKDGDILVDSGGARWKVDRKGGFLTLLDENGNETDAVHRIDQPERTKTKLGGGQVTLPANPASKGAIRVAADAKLESVSKGVESRPDIPNKAATKSSFTVTSENWRKVYDESAADPFRQKDILKRLANSKSTSAELSDILDRLQKNVPATGAYDIAHDVAMNPAASPELKSRANALYEYRYPPTSPQDYTEAVKHVEARTTEPQSVPPKAPTKSQSVPAVQAAVKSQTKVANEVPAEKSVLDDRNMRAPDGTAESFNERDARIKREVKASKAAGKQHVDQLPYGVETMRGVHFKSLRDGSGGTITGVDNRDIVHYRGDDGNDSIVHRNETAEWVVDGRRGIKYDRKNERYVITQPKGSEAAKIEKSNAAKEAAKKKVWSEIGNYKDHNVQMYADKTYGVENENGDRLAQDLPDQSAAVRFIDNLGKSETSKPAENSSPISDSKVEVGHREVIPTGTQEYSSTERIATPTQEGHTTKLLTSSGELPAQYAVVEASSLRPSHDPITFTRNPEYPSGVQERAYDTSKEAQQRVISQAQNYEPMYTVNTNPDAVNGPPVIMPDGTVLGGNSRAMSTVRLYKSGNAAKYRDALLSRAREFGISQPLAEDMKEPVLVRQLTKPPTNIDEMRSLASELNKSMTGALGVSERAVSVGKAISRDSLNSISGMLDGMGESASLRDLLRERGADVLNALVKDGAITDRERPQYVDTSTGGLSEEGKTFVERALLGSVVDDPRLMDSAPKATLNKLDGSLASLASISPRTDAYNVLPLIREALRDHAEIAQRGMKIDDYLAQGGLFGGSERDPGVDAVVRLLGEKPTIVKARLRRFAEDANFDVQGQGTLGMFEQPSPAKAFNDAFGTNLTDEQLENSILKAVQSEPTISGNGGKAQAVGTTEKSAGSVQRRETGEPRPGGESRTRPAEKNGSKVSPKETSNLSRLPKVLRSQSQDYNA